MEPLIEASARAGGGANEGQAPAPQIDIHGDDADYAAANRQGMEAWSDYFEKHSLPLAEYRLF